MSTVVMKDHYAHWSGLFTKEELTTIDEYILKNVEPSSSLVSSSKEEIPEIRKSTLYWVNNNPDTEWIFRRINAAGLKLNSHFFGFEAWPVSTLQYTIYEEGGDHYTWHQDMHLEKGLQSLDLTFQRKFSLVMLCQKCEEGGDLELLWNSSPVAPNLEEGNAVVFPSFTVHRVTPVVKGIRKSLVAWFEGPDWR